MTEFEASLTDLIGRRYAVQVGTGTGALTLALLSLGVGKGHEVIVPSIVCYSVPFAVLYTGARPIFCDVCPNTLNMDPQSVVSAINDRTKAIIAVHLFGYPCDIRRLEEIANSYGLYLIEDFAQGFGGKYDGRYLGAYGVVSITSFGKDKIIDAGGGGILLTDEVDIAAKARELLNGLPAKKKYSVLTYQGLYRLVFGSLKLIDGDIIKWRRTVRKIATLFRPLFLFQLSDSQAIKIQGRLQNLHDIIARRYENAMALREMLPHSLVMHLDYQMRPDVAYMKYTVILKEAMASVLCKRWSTRPITALYPPMHQIFAPRSTLPVADKLAGHLVNFPVSPAYSLADIRMLAKQATQRLDKALSEKGSVEYYDA